ncbi:MAG: lamin tail domain-containing protein [Flavobacteriales bacterium]|nr:lamin tail domain-containing protein [Flavobacteriales bacterium]
MGTLSTASMAQVTVFSENMGTPGGTTAITTHDGNNGFQNSATYTYTGTGDVRTSTASSGYTGSSGSGNVFLTYGRTFTISGVSTTGYTGLALSFGAHKNSTSSDMTELLVEASTDGVAWTTLTFPPQATGSGTANWRSVDITGGTIPAAPSVQFRWTNTATVGPQFRVDDVTLTGTLPGGCGITLGTESAVCFTVTSGPGDTYDLSIPYTGVDAGTTVVNNSGSGSIGGDDPAEDNGGTITITGIDEADAYNVTFTSPCNALVVSGSAPVCEPLPDIAINEFLADPDAAAGDANGDGTVDTSEDEFVELVNFGATPIDISGWTISDAVGVRHTFPAATSVPAGCAIVVFGGGSPTGAFGFAAVQTASAGFLGLNNGGDDVILRDASATVVASYTYGGEGGNNQSLTRDPDITGSFVEHSAATGAAGALHSPGTLIDGSSFSGCAPPACAIVFGIESTLCTTTTPGPGDTYSVSIPYTGSQAGVSVINNSGSGGGNTGDDPATVPNGTIVIAGITEGTGYNITLSAPCGSEVATGSSPNCEPLPEIAINEILADPSNVGMDGDANGDGTVNSSDDEFVELVNFGATPLDISGWTLSDAVAVRHTFPASTVIPAGCGIVVFGGGTPTGTFGFTTVQTASTGSLILNNGGDDVVLRDGASNIVATYTYGSEGGNNESLTRDPDITGAFVQHSIATGSAGTLFSPGTLIDGSSFSGCAPPACGIVLGSPTTTCLSFSPGSSDTYRVDIPYTGSEAGVTVINNSGSGGGNIGDDPATVPNGTITISGITEGTPFDIALTAPCTGSVSGASPACDPVPTLLINEVDPNQPGTDTGEFIEILNAGATSANLDGLQLLLYNGSSDALYSTTILDNVSLAPGDYYVVCYGSNASAYCDQTGVGGSIQNGNPDGIRLTTADGLTIIDQMSYGGTMITTEGSSAPSDLDDAGLGVARIPNGADTDDNGADFIRNCITPGAANTFDDADMDGTVDCLDVCPGGPEPFSACDDGNANTGNDIVQPDCSCLGEALDCLGIPGGPNVPGADCDDMDPNTVNDVYQANCSCLGEVLDCLGTPGGTALPGSPCDDGQASTFNDVYGTDCICAGELCTEDLVLEFQNATNPGAVTWEIRNESGTAVVLSGTNVFPANSIGTQAICLPDGCYRLSVTDPAGDGITGYELRESGMNGRRIIDNTGNSITGTSAIANGGTFCLPIGNTGLIYSNCDKMDWVNYQYLVCHEEPLVSAEWQVGNQNNDGYNFWIFDPNGTYSFRRFHTHAVSDGFSPASATRAARIKINGWNDGALTPHIPSGVLLNVRVRGVYNWNFTEWGPTCTMMIDPVAASCPMIWLQDDPANTSDYSCNVTRNFGGPNGGANKLTAKPPQFQPAPLAGGTGVRYQFRFRIPGEGVCIVRPPQTSPTLYLNWSAASGPQLEASKTYEVEVRVSKDQGATWCVDSPSPACDPNPVTNWGRTCDVTINGPTPEPTCTDGIMNGDEEGVDCGGSCPLSCEAAALQLDPSFTMYPNPNNGEQLFINLTELAPELSTVSVDIYDLTGKRITARTIAVQDGYINTTLDLNGDVASGLYMVNITAGDKTYTERLVIQK